MNRKHFISSLVTAGVVLPLSDSEVFAKGKREPKRLRTPPYLVSGDTIGITCPAGYITREAIQPSIDLMQSWGFKIVVGKAIGQRSFTLGGTDEERRTDFQEMLDNKDIKAIMCARGGYGVVRIIDQLDFSRFTRDPKWIIGFSDVTVFHSHLNRVYNIASIHSKMCNSFPANWSLAEPLQIDTILSIKKALMGEKMSYASPPSEFNRLGKARGALVGGNLSMLAAVGGSNSDIKTKGKILFLEETSEELYSIDRMFFNLKRSGKLDNLAGLVIGGFKLKVVENADDFGKTVTEIVMEKVKEFSYPVCFNFPVGHQKNNFALKCGVEHHLWVNELGGLLET